MKYVLILFGVVAGLWLWRTKRPAPVVATQATDQSVNQTVDKTVNNALQMVRCTHCSLHVPQGDALVGKQGWYCGIAHKNQQEG